MFRRVWRWLARKRGIESDDESAERRFVPSRLDFSVRFSHGGGNAEAARELDDIDSEARKLEEERHET